MNLNYNATLRCLLTIPQNPSKSGEEHTSKLTSDLHTHAQIHIYTIVLLKIMPTENRTISRFLSFNIKSFYTRIEILFYKEVFKVLKGITY